MADMCNKSAEVFITINIYEPCPLKHQSALYFTFLEPLLFYSESYLEHEEVPQCNISVYSGARD